MAANTISLAVMPTPGSPSHFFGSVPWYPGITVLDALILADAMIEDTFTFTILYGSGYGAFVQQFDQSPPPSGAYWMLYVNNILADHGVSETMLNVGDSIEFRLEASAGHKQMLAMRGSAGASGAA